MRREPRSQSRGLFGTALDPEAKDIKKKLLPVWKQEVTDNEGRRRFHGAWTGGFSAGYFNTVGSEKGFTPSTFRSDRSNRSAVSQPKAEDFMDEEDYVELMTGGKALTTSSIYDSFGTAGELASRQGSSTLTDFSELFTDQPNQLEPIGVKLLKQMGWREGKGIGPRVSRPSDPNDPHASKYTAAPDKTDINWDLFKPKTNFHGIGYDPYQADPEAKSNVKKSNDNLKQGVVKMSSIYSSKTSGSRGLGLGAFENADDFDVYGDDDSSNRFVKELKIQDEIEEEEEEDSGISFLTLQRSRNKNNNLKRKRDQNVKIIKCIDGRDVLEGFILAVNGQIEEKEYPPPSIPDGWSWGAGDVKDGKTEIKDNLYTRTLTAENRGKMLNEDDPKENEKKSVFDFLDPKDKEKLLKATGKITDIENIKTEVEHQNEEEEEEEEGHGYHRFKGEPAKQFRFRNYLLEATGQEPLVMPKKLRDLTDKISSSELEKEKEEFKIISDEFRKVPDMMASRFTKAKDKDLQFQNDINENNNLQNEIQPKENFFKRIEVTWQPENLLCKRFNIKKPVPEKDTVMIMMEKEMKKEKQENILPILTSKNISDKNLNQNNNNKFNNFIKKEETIEEQLEHVKQQNEDDEDEGERPPMDLFKAIFEADESDDEESFSTQNKISFDIPKLIPMPQLENIVVEDEKGKEQEEYTQPAFVGVVERSKENPYLYFPQRREERGNIALGEVKKEKLDAELLRSNADNGNDEWVEKSYESHGTKRGRENSSRHRKRKNKRHKSKRYKE